MSIEVRRCKMTYAAILLAAAGVTAHGQTFESLAYFNGTDGGGPYENGLIQGLDGNFYGLTSFLLGTAAQTIYKATPAGAITSLYTFCSQLNCTDGQDPVGSLLLATDGNFYGATYVGDEEECGVVFRLTPSKVYTVLYSFTGLSGDGCNPSGGLIEGTDKNLYGMTSAGGVYTSGTVYKLPLSGGSPTIIYSFGTQAGDGSEPAGGLVQASNGLLYGTTLSGPRGYGTLFKVTTAGKLTTLYTFCAHKNCTDGNYPNGDLIQAADGNLYGSTYYGGGASGTDGTVFQITPGGRLTTLYQFCAQPKCSDGEQPRSGLVQANDGNFYGATYGGGAYHEGVLYQMTVTPGTKPTAAVTKLHDFCQQTNCPDGGSPASVLMQSTNGTLYGNTYIGCAAGCDSSQSYGTIFSLSMGLEPFLKAVPTSGKVGSPVKILGNGLTGATAVTFNGLAATTFKVVKDTEITATVPTGATSGEVVVTTPTGTLSTYVPFTVK